MSWPRRTVTPLLTLTRVRLGCRVIIVIKINNIFPAPASGMIGQPTEIDSGAVSMPHAFGVFVSAVLTQHARFVPQPIRAGAAPAKADAPRSYGAAGGGGGGYGGGNAYGGGRPSGYGNQGTRVCRAVCVNAASSHVVCAHVFGTQAPLRDRPT